ncbi:bacteriocin fulvocin C-related protein [Streptomyces sp. NPDC058371]|uniref:bacteriocin fulvocin C-related protein n=1 Tax=Streptomyces sp. NPDC058371 TaxID=3346463 RepID=UPI00364E0105
MDNSRVRWMLAFDSSCGACRTISSIVFGACDGKLEVVPLGRQDVRDWRERALGRDAPWAPTLLAVRRAEGGRSKGDDARVKAWTGAGIALPLARRLGPRSTLAVLRALGQARAEGAKASTGGRALMGRAQFLRLGGGVAVAAAVLLKGTTPAFAQGKDQATAREWVRAHADRLPTRYGDVAALPLAHRRAVFAALPAKARSALWVEHIERFRADHQGLTPGQASVVEQAHALASKVSTFEFERGRRGAEEAPDLDARAVAAFGATSARALLATLGPAEALALPDCECNVFSDYCINSGCVYVQNTCEYDSSGCGKLWTWACDGLCYG